MSNNYLNWFDVPYAGEDKAPDNPVETLAGSWSLYYLKRGFRGDFLDPFGRRLLLPLKNPSEIDWDKELKIVQKTLATLTPLQRKIGIYFGTGVPTKQWTPVIDRLIDTYGVTPPRAARIIAAVHAAINDTMIVVWDLKYRWNVARPDQYDQNMATLLCTPRFPAYPSGHATMSGCAEVVLSYFFPLEAPKLRQIAENDAVSRLYAGVHFPSDNDEGLKLGRHIGRCIADYLKIQSDENLKPIDLPYNENHDANLDPVKFRQFIPYDFPANCTSLVLPSKAPWKENKPILYI